MIAALVILYCPAMQRFQRPPPALTGGLSQIGFIFQRLRRSRNRSPSGLKAKASSSRQKTLAEKSAPLGETFASNLSPAPGPMAAEAAFPPKKRITRGHHTRVARLLPRVAAEPNATPVLLWTCAPSVERTTPLCSCACQRRAACTTHYLKRCSHGRPFRALDESAGIDEFIYSESSEQLTRSKCPALSCRRRTESFLRRRGVA